MSPAVAVLVAGLAALLARPCTQLLGRHAGWPLAALYLAAAGTLVPAVSPALEGEPLAARIPWVPARGWTLDLVAGPTGVFFAFLALLIGAIVLVYSTAYLRDHDDTGRHLHHHGFYQLMTLFTVSMLGLVLTDSLVVLFVCWELTSLASFALIADSGRSAHASAVRTLTVTFLGGVTLLAAVVWIRVRLGSDSLSVVLAHDVWQTDPGFTAGVAVLVALAAMTKSAQFPFSFWLPDAMAAITPVSAYLHAAAVVKAGVFLLLRFSPALHSSPVWSGLLVTVGMVTAVVAALFALQKTDLKQLMAYSTVSQLGWIVAAIGVGTQAAIVAAALHTLAHALFKSGLFMLVGVIDHQAGTRDLRRLGPLWRRMPWTFGATVLGAAGMAGIPPTLGFVSKESMLAALGDVGVASSPLGAPSSVAASLVLAAAVAGAVLTVGYSARIVLGAFVDGPRELGEVREAPVRFWLPAALPAVLGLPLALVVAVLDDPLTALAHEAAGPWGPPVAGNVHGLIPGVPVDELLFHAHPRLWHGLTTELMVTALIFAIAGVLVWRRAALSRRLEGREFLPFTGADALETLMTATVRTGRRLVRPTGSDSPSRHAAALLASVIAFALLTSTVALASGTVFPERTPGTDRIIDVVVLVVVTASVLGLVVSPSRMAGVVLLSAVGMSVTVQLFGLGAPDVGLTQLLVESVSVVVYMLALRRLPGTFVRPARRRRTGAAVLAVAAGVAATAAVLVFTGRRERSELGRYLLDNGYEITGGHNVVNTVLVEFRALDTFGEVSVLGIAGIGIVAVLTSVRPTRRTRTADVTVAAPPWTASPPRGAAALADARRNTAPLLLLSRVAAPVLVVVALLLLWRGHNAPGGGFIAALVASCALCLGYLARPEDRPVSRRRNTPVLLIGGGLLLAGVTGLAGVALGSFLQPGHGYLLGQHLSTALVFDLGVFAAVVGLVTITLDVVGTDRLRTGSEGAVEAPR